MVTWKDVLAELKSRPTVSVPTAGRALGDLSRNGAYEAARRARRPGDRGRREEARPERRRPAGPRAHRGWRPRRLKRKGALFTRAPLFQPIRPFAAAGDTLPAREL